MARCGSRAASDALSPGRLDQSLLFTITTVCLNMPITSCCGTLLFFDWHRKIHLQLPAHSIGTGTPCTVCDACFATAASLHRHYLDGYHLPAVRRLRSTCFLPPQSETDEEQAYCQPCCRAFHARYGHSARTRLQWHNAVHHLPAFTRSSPPLRSQNTSGFTTWATPPPTPRTGITPTPTPTPIYAAMSTQSQQPAHTPTPRPPVTRKPTLMPTCLDIPATRPTATSHLPV